MTQSFFQFGQKIILNVLVQIFKASSSFMILVVIPVRKFLKDYPSGLTSKFNQFS